MKQVDFNTVACNDAEVFFELTPNHSSVSLNLRCCVVHTSWSKVIFRSIKETHNKHRWFIHWIFIPLTWLHNVVKSGWLCTVMTILYNVVLNSSLVVSKNDEKTVWKSWEGLVLCSSFTQLHIYYKLTAQASYLRSTTTTVQQCLQFKF